MDARDRGLLERQMRQCQLPPPGNGRLTLFGAALFASGLIFRRLTVFSPSDRHTDSYAMGNSLEQIDEPGLTSPKRGVRPRNNRDTSSVARLLRLPTRLRLLAEMKQALAEMKA